MRATADLHAHYFPPDRPGSGRGESQKGLEQVGATVGASLNQVVAAWEESRQ